MGVVYEAHDPNIDRHVAIKTIRLDDLAEDLAAEYELRFKVEARAAGRLHHPNIVGVYDAGRDAGMAYMVMELVQGSDLKRALAGGTRYTLEQSLHLMAELLGALEFAHGQSVVHRDVKPANVMLDRNGRVKLTDFGLARLVDVGDATRTRGTALGTPRYMSPEQVRGEKVDGRTDLFSAGVILCQMVTGVVPFEGESDFAVMRNVCVEPHRPPTASNPALPPALDGLMDKLLAKAREDRFATAAEFASALLALAEGAGAAELQAVPAQAAPHNNASADRHEVNSQYSATLLLDSVPGASSATPSTVVQELEMTSWKRIQGSAEAHDFEGFLARFPAGVYADLARRRLRKIGGFSGSTTRVDIIAPAAQSSPLVGSDGWAVESTVDEDATLLISPVDRSARWLAVERPSSAGTKDEPPAGSMDAQATTSVAEQIPPPAIPSLPEPAPPPAPVAVRTPNDAISDSPSTPADQDVPRLRPSLWWSAGVVVGAVLVAIGFWMLRPQPKQTIDATAAAPAVVASAPALQPVAAAELPQASASLTSTEQGLVPGGANAERTSLPASAAVAVAAPAALIASAPAKPRKATAKPPTVTAAAPDVVPEPAPAESAPPVAVVPPPPVVNTGPSSPSEACASRNILTRSMCEYRQCATPQFKDHAECVAMRERERERERAR